MNFTEFLESKKPLPMGKMVLKALSKDKKAEKEPNIEKKTKLENQARVLQMAAAEQIEYLLSDPLEDLYDLAEAEMNISPKPPIENDPSSGVEGPASDNYQHPVIQKRNKVDSARMQGMSAPEAHQSVHGEVDLGDVTSKAELAGTLGRYQDDNGTRAVTIEKDKGSILAKDAELEKKIDQVTRNDLRSPMYQQVPDVLQEPSQEVAEALDFGAEYDYNEDVAYLQQFGRA